MSWLRTNDVYAAMDNPTPLRLLLIEDSPDDELMVLLALRETGFDVTHRCVQTEPDLRAALDDDEGWDVVIADYSLPAFNGLKALEIVRGIDADLPFFFVSGIVHDDLGIVAMEGGANDYLLKDNLSRLGPALRRELGEASLRQAGRITSALHRSVLETAMDAIISADEEMNIRLFNRGAKIIFGYTEEQIVGHPFSDLLAQGGTLSINVASGVADRELRGRNGRGWQTLCRRSDGRLFPAEINISSSQIGSRTFYTAILRDVTERQEAEDAIRTSEMRLRLMTQNIKDYSIVMLDSDGCVLSWNEGAQRLTGFEAEEIVGKSMGVLHLPEDEADGLSHRLLDEARRSGRAEDEGWRVRKDGSRFFANVIISVMHDESGALIGFAKITRDITVRKALEDALVRQNEELEERVKARTVELEQARQMAETLAKAKSDFLANMSHEIRTPMNAVLGLAYMLSRMSLPEDAADLARKIHSSGQLLLGILNDILDFSKIDAGRLELEKMPFHLDDIFNNLGSVMHAQAVDKGLEFRIVAPPHGSTYLLGDALRLEQILINLTSNAIKFTRQGRVEVGVELIEQQAQSTRLRFWVRDTGIGMDDATQARVFAPFVQADTSTTRRFGGTGLGLAISRRLVDMMGGQILLQSQPGQGSEFSFSLSFERHVSEPVLVRVPALEVIIISPVAKRWDVLADGLGSVGWSVRRISSSEDAALARRLAAAEEQRQCVVVMLEFDHAIEELAICVARVRRHASEDSALAVLAVVSEDASVMARDVNKVCGIDAVLVTPVSVPDFYNTVVRILNCRRGTGSLSRQEPGERLKGVRILIVDDSEINLEVTDRILRLEGAVIERATNGQEALDWLKAHPRGVDIVLMDIHMPVMDGLEATRHLRRLPGFANLPVLALTAGAFKDQREQASAAGMNGFICKPFAVDAVVGLIHSMLSGHIQQIEDAAAVQEELPTLSVAHGLVMNTDYGLSIFRVRKNYERYLRMFLSQYREFSTVLAHNAHDNQAISALAHKLKGGAGALGLEQASSLAAALQAAATSGKDVDETRQRLREVLDMTFRVIEGFISPQDDHAKAGVAIQNIDLEKIGVLLLEGLAGAESFNPDRVEPVIAGLQAFFPPARLNALAESLARFDFVAVDEQLRKLAAECDISLESFS